MIAVCNEGLGTVQNPVVSVFDGIGFDPLQIASSTCNTSDNPSAVSDASFCTYQALSSQSH